MHNTCCTHFYHSHYTIPHAALTSATHTTQYLCCTHFYHSHYTIPHAALTCTIYTTEPLLICILLLFHGHLSVLPQFALLSAPPIALAALCNLQYFHHQFLSQLHRTTQSNLCRLTCLTDVDLKKIRNNNVSSIMIGSITKMNLNHQKVHPILKLRLQHIPSKKGKRGDSMVNYQKFLTMPACIYNLLDYREHGGSRLLFNSGTNLPIYMASYPMIFESFAGRCLLAFQ